MAHSRQERREVSEKKRTRRKEMQRYKEHRPTPYKREGTRHDDDTLSR